MTPLQIANLSATVANRGYYYIPHIIKESEDISIDPKYKERNYTMVDTTEFRKVINTMIIYRYGLREIYISMGQSRGKMNPMPYSWSRSILK